MSYDIYTKQYLDFLDKFYDKINLMSDWSLDEIVDFIRHKAFHSAVVVDLLFAVVFVKFPEEILIGIESRPKRIAYLAVGRPGEQPYSIFIWAEIQGKGRITDQAAREALLSKKDRDIYIEIPRLIRAAEEMIPTCKIERW